MSEDRSYFAYGERTPRLMEAIIGRRAVYEPAAITNFGLYVQRFVDTPEVVQGILAVNRSPQEMAEGRAYVAAPMSKAQLVGAYYPNLASHEIALLDNYDIDGLWFRRLTDRLIHIANPPDGSTSRLGRADLHGEAAGVTTPYIGEYEGLFPEPLTDEDRAVEIATIARKEYEATNPVE